jgi:hypothetical protein
MYDFFLISVTMILCEKSFGAIFEDKIEVVKKMLQNNLLILKPLCYVHMKNMKKKKFNQSICGNGSKLVFCMKLHNCNLLGLITVSTTFILLNFMHSIYYTTFMMISVRSGSKHHLRTYYYNLCI